MITLGKEFGSEEHVPKGVKILAISCDGSARVYRSRGEPSRAQPWLRREFELLDPENELMIDDWQDFGGVTWNHYC
jgi:hypothetical protein